MGNEDENAASAAATGEVVLKHPVTWADDRVTKVTVRRPKGKDFKGLKDLKNDSDSQMKLMARLISQPTSFVDEMDFEDIESCMDVVMGFLSSAGK